MAKTYLDIQNSAYKVGNIMDWTNALTRLSGVPVDITEVYDSYDKAVEYAATNPVAYEGQVISVTENGKTTVYVITPTVFGTHTVGEGDDAVVYNNYLAEVGSKTEGDGNTIELDGQTLKLAGLKDLDNSKTYVPSLEGGKLVWRLPDNSTVEGLDAAVSALDTRTEALETVVNGKAAAGETPAVVGLVDIVGAHTQAIGVAAKPESTEGAGDAVEATGLYKAIDDARAEAKQYTDEKAYDDTALANRVTTIENAVNHETTGLEAHEARIAAMETFWSATEDSDGIVNKLKEIQDYIASDETGAATMAGDIKANTEAIAVLNGDVTKAGSVAKAVADAVAPLATAADLNDVRATAEAAATASDIETAIAGKANTADVYTKTEVNELIGEPGTPAVKDEEGNVTTEAVAGTGVYQHVYSKDEVTSLIADITGGESAADVLAALNAYKTTNDTRVKAVEDENASQDSAIADADAKGQQGIKDAAAAKTAADNAALAVTNLSNGQVTTNKNDIAAINALVSGTGSETPETSHAARIGVLETYKTTHTGEFNTLKSSVETNAANIATKANAADVYTKAQVEGLVNAKANSADVYTKGETDSAISGAVSAAVAGIDLKPYAKAADVETTVQGINAAIAEKANASDVYTKTEADAAFMTQTEVDDRINALIKAADPAEGKTIENITNLVKYVDENAGEIAELVTTVGDNTKAIQANAKDIADINAAIAAIVAPKASAEISVGTDGTIGIIEMNVNKLVQTEGDVLILNGGNAGQVKTEA
jgi:hypothetical protein